MISAVLLDDVTVRVLDISAGGCLLEAGKQLPIGTVGSLDLELDGSRRFEWFRISRVHGLQSAGGWLCGAEFLPLTIAGADSLRGVMRRGKQPARTAAMPKLAGRSSGDTGKSARGTDALTSAAKPGSGDLGQKTASSNSAGEGNGNGSLVAEITRTDAPGMRGNKGEVLMKSLIARLVRDDQGQDLIEYVLIGTLVSIAVVIGAGLLGTQLNAWYNAMAGWVTGMIGQV
jgi:pilus assembly protein Flp/PilA